MTAEILDIGELTLELVDPDGTSHWHVTATIADAIVTIPARYHPAELASPDEYGPALCSSSFELEPDAPPPPVMGTTFDQVQYLEALDLDWEVTDSD